jgi:hypothetical protein
LPIPVSSSAISSEIKETNYIDHNRKMSKCSNDTIDLGENYVAYNNSKIQEKHYQEWLQSAISHSMIVANLQSCNQYDSFEKLTGPLELDRINTGRLSAKWLRLWHALEDGGWWVIDSV